MNKSRTLMAIGAVCVLFLAGVVTKALAGEKDLVGYWRFDEKKGDVAYDSSGNNNHGKIYNGTWADGKTGTALKFDGKSAYVEVPKSASLDNLKQITLTAWVKIPISATPATHSIFARWYYGGSASERSLELDISETKVVNFAISAMGWAPDFLLPPPRFTPISGCTSP